MFVLLELFANKTFLLWCLYVSTSVVAKPLLLTLKMIFSKPACMYIFMVKCV